MEGTAVGSVGGDLAVTTPTSAWLQGPALCGSRWHTAGSEGDEGSMWRR